MLKTSDVTLRMNIDRPWGSPDICHDQAQCPANGGCTPPTAPRVVVTAVEINVLANWAIDDRQDRRIVRRRL